MDKPASNSNDTLGSLECDILLDGSISGGPSNRSNTSPEENQQEEKVTNVSQVALVVEELVHNVEQSLYCRQCGSANHSFCNETNDIADQSNVINWLSNKELINNMPSYSLSSQPLDIPTSPIEAPPPEMVTSTTTSLAAQIQSLQSENRTPGGSYTTEWIGQVQHRPKIIPAQAIVRNPSGQKAGTNTQLQPSLPKQAMEDIINVCKCKSITVQKKQSSTKSVQTDCSEQAKMNGADIDASTKGSATTQVSMEHVSKVGMYLLELFEYKEKYEHDRMTDVIVRVGSCTFSAHGIILSCYSSVLAAIIKEQNKAKNWNGVIEIKENVTPTAFQVLLDYMYKGEIDVAFDNLAEVLCASTALSMEPVRSMCVEKLHRTDARAALRVLENAHSDKIRDAVKESMLKLIASGFQDVMRSVELQTMCVDCLCEVLSNDSLVVATEYDVVIAALYWIDYDNERVPDLSRVLGCAELSRLSTEELFMLSNAAPYIMDEPAIRTMILEANWQQSSISVSRPSSLSSVTPKLRPRYTILQKPIQQQILAKLQQDQENSEGFINRELLETQQMLKKSIESIPSDSGSAGVLGMEDLSRKESPRSSGSSSNSVKVFRMKQQKIPSKNALSPSIADEVVALSRHVSDVMSPLVQEEAAVEEEAQEDGGMCAPCTGGASQPLPIPRSGGGHGAVNGMGQDDGDENMGEEGEEEGEGGSGHFLLMLGGYKLHDNAGTPGCIYAERSFRVERMLGAKQKVRSIQYYSSQQNLWTTLTSRLPEPRAHHSIVYFNNFIYVIGGYNPLACGGFSVHRPLCTVYRVSTLDESGWLELTPLRTPRMFHHSVVLNGAIYTIGGQNTHSILGSVERYVPEHNMWEEVAPLCTPRLGCAATCWNNTILVVGGIGGKYVSPLDSVEQYDPETECWTELCRLRYARCYPGLRCVAGCLFIVGGLHDVENDLVPTPEIDEYDEGNNSWIKCTDMASPRYDMACVADGEHLLILGGVSAFATALSTVERYDVMSREWIPAQPCLPQPLAGPRCFVAKFNAATNDYSH